MSFVLPTQRALEGLFRAAKKEGVDVTIDLMTGEMRVTLGSPADSIGEGLSHVEQGKRRDKSARNKARQSA